MYPSSEKLTEKTRMRLDSIRANMDQLMIRWNPAQGHDTEKAELIMKNGEKKELTKLGRAGAPEQNSY